MSTAKTTYSRARTYYDLAKPGIIYGNLLTGAAGFLFASHWRGDWGTMFFMLVGLGLIVGCGCVINNVIDKDIDSLMERTKKRAIVSGHIKTKMALIYGAVLGLLGALILGLLTNGLTLAVGLFGLFIYLVPYTLSKRKTQYSTLIGAVAGAMPPLAGFVAYSGYIGGAGIVLVGLIASWQLTHFYAIALYRKKEYKAANLPIWSVVNGDWSTQLQSISFIGIFTLFGVCLFILGYTGYLFVLGILALGLGWLWYSVTLASKLTASAWGRKIFLSSLWVILITSLLLAIGPVIY